MTALRWLIQQQSAGVPIILCEGGGVDSMAHKILLCTAMVSAQT